MTPQTKQEVALAMAVSVAIKSTGQEALQMGDFFGIRQNAEIKLEKAA